MTLVDRGILSACYTLLLTSMLSLSHATQGLHQLSLGCCHGS